LTTFLLIIATYIGSRNLQNFDAALIGYLFATIFACFGLAAPSFTCPSLRQLICRNHPTQRRAYQNATKQPRRVPFK
jgi:hypothetical protein